MGREIASRFFNSINQINIIEWKNQVFPTEKCSGYLTAPGILDRLDPRVARLVGICVTLRYSDTDRVSEADSHTTGKSHWLCPTSPSHSHWLRCWTLRVCCFGLLLLPSSELDCKSRRSRPTTILSATNKWWRPTTFSQHLRSTPEDHDDFLADEIIQSLVFSLSTDTHKSIRLFPVGSIGWQSPPNTKDHFESTLDTVQIQNRLQAAPSPTAENIFPFQPS